MLRRLVKILLVLVGLIVMAAAIVHGVLKSDWLQRLILTAISERTGMEVTCESLEVRWGGRTTLRGPAVKMPLADDVVLSADEIEISHVTVPLLILGRPTHVRSVQVDSPRINLRQDENGRWNVQDVWTRLSASLSSSGRQTGPIPLPRVVVQDALVQITEPNGTVRTVGPLDFRAELQGPLLWQFDLRLSQIAEVKGRAAPGGDWTHDVRFTVADVGSLVHRFLGSGLTPIRAAGRWEGRVLGDAVTGMLRLDELAVGPVAARGGVHLEAKAGRISLSPQDLVLSDPNLVGEEIRLAGGSVQIAGRQVHVEQLSVASGPLTARVDGGWDWIAGAGELTASWAAISDGNSLQCSGMCRASMDAAQFGRRTARASVTADAETSVGDVTVTANVDGAGVDWQQSQWRISAPTCVWARDGKQVDLSGAAAEIHVDWPSVRLVSLRVPQTQATNAVAQFDPSTRRWSANLAVEGLSQLKSWGLEPLDLRVNAEGDARTAHISELRITQGRGIATARGDMSFAEWGFQNVRLAADWLADSAAGDGPQAAQSLGRWHLEGDVFGRVRPLAVEMTGQMTGRNIAVGKEAVDRVEVPVRATVNRREARVTTDAVDFLGGRWLASGRHDLPSHLTQVAVMVDGLSLESVAAMAGLTQISEGRTHAEIQLAAQDFDIGSVVATGSWSAEDINVPPLRIPRAHGGVHFSDGLARFDRIVLEQEGGQAEASVEFRLDDLESVCVELTAHQWQTQLNGHLGSFCADGKARLRVNAIERTVDGQADLSGQVVWTGQPLAQVRVSALVHERTLDVQAFHAETLGGVVTGRAMVPLNGWKNSTAKLNWQGIEPKLLQQWAPQFGRFEGVVSGSLEVGQAEPATRPPEPMRFVLDANVQDGRFGPAHIDSCRLVAFLGDRRLLIDEANLEILDGQFKAKTRVSTHAGGYQGSVVADFNDLKLDQLVHVIDPNASEYAGRLSGNGTVLASSDWHSFGGEVQVKLMESDLVGNSVVRVLHNTLNLQLGKQQPTGTGEVAVRLEGPSVVIPSLTYFNRGVEIRGAGRIQDIREGSQSPIEGFAVGSTRVLKGIRLPGVNALDQLLATFQAGAASVKIAGTVGKVETKVVPLPEVLNPFRSLLWAQLRK
ncbi:MAG: hypothetical protein ABFD90_15850 [Phycisphaerales bacterium]